MMQARHHRAPAATAALACALALAAPAAAAPDGAGDWPAYRGAGGTGVSTETGLLTAWPESGPKILWRFPLGNGYSGMSVSGGRLYTMYSDRSDEFVLCLDARTGKQIWRTRSGPNQASGQGDGPRSTPTVDGNLVFAIGAGGLVHALDARTGAPAWSVDLKKEFGGRVPRWGMSTSPFIEDGMLLIDAGGRPGSALVALDKTTGRVRWTSHTDKPGYSTPIGFTVGGVRQVLFFTGGSLVAVSPADGTVLWSVPWETSYDVNAAMPVFVPPDGVFVSSSYDTGAALFRIRVEDGAVTADEIWSSRVMKNHFNSSVLYRDHLYGFDDGTLKCIDPHTGEELWKQRGFAKGSLLVADGHLVILSEDGLLALAEATPEGYHEKARIQVLEGRTWTMPSLAAGRLYVRNQKELLALDLARPTETRP